MRVIVVAGGRSSRLGPGQHKPAQLIGGRTLLDRVLAAVPPEADIVVVGPTQPTRRPVRWTREDPPFSGPVAAVAAGLALFPPADGPVAVLAADLPWLDPATLAAVRDAAPALARDADGRDQPLLAVHDETALRAAMPPDPVGASWRPVLAALALTRVAVGPAAADCDTPAELAAARAQATCGALTSADVTDPTAATPTGPSSPPGGPPPPPDVPGWLARVASALGVPPLGDEEVAVLLELTKDVAHGVARLAAPLTAFLIGRSGDLSAGVARVGELLGPTGGPPTDHHRSPGPGPGTPP